MAHTDVKIYNIIAYSADLTLTFVKLTKSILFLKSNVL